MYFYAKVKIQSLFAILNIWLRYLDAKKIGMEVFGEIRNVLLEKNREESIKTKKMDNFQNKAVNL